MAVPHVHCVGNQSSISFLVRGAQWPYLCKIAAPRRKQERCCKNCPVGLSCLKWHSRKVSQCHQFPNLIEFSPIRDKNWMCIGETVIYHRAWADAANFVVAFFFLAFSEGRNDTLLTAFVENRFLYYCPGGHGSRAWCLVALHGFYLSFTLRCTETCLSLDASLKDTQKYLVYSITPHLRGSEQRPLRKLFGVPLCKVDHFAPGNCFHSL